MTAPVPPSQPKGESLTTRSSTMPSSLGKMTDDQKFYTGVAGFVLYLVFVIFFTGGGWPAFGVLVAALILIGAFAG